MYAQCGESLDRVPQAGINQIPASHLMPLIHATQQRTKLPVDMLPRDQTCNIPTQNDKLHIAVSIAIASNNIARLKQLLCHSHLGISSSKKSPLAIALEYQRHDILRQLLDDCRVDANAKDSKGHTPLHLAVIYDDPVAF
ncbi:euchromatic histone-lysine N-methyltransferase 1 [Penicillium herquei]|nr:euchromatic histone-lysine N-methyltransferase 1 [Penicillium herquei]